MLSMSFAALVTIILEGVVLMEMRYHRHLDAVPVGPLPTIPSARTFDGVGARVEPVDPSVVPVIPASQATDAASKNDLVRAILRDLPPTQVLLVHYENQFGTEQADGTEVPSVPRQLAWLAEYDDVHSSVMSGPAGAIVNPKDWTCTYYVAVSASSAAVLDVFDLCE